VQPTTAQDATGWQFTAAPYVWAPSTSLDSSINGIATGGDFSGDSNTDFVDVLEELEFAFLGHAEAKKDRFTLFGDLIYLRLSPEHQTAPFNVGPLSFSSAQFKLELEATIIEAGGTYEFARGEISELSTGRAASAELLAGVRYTTLDVEAKFSTSVSGPFGFFSRQVAANLELSPEIVDPIIGARASVPLGGKWDLKVRGDIGGFGVGSELTWNTAAFLNYAAWDSVSLLFGYRALGYELEETVAGRRTELDILFHGPAIAAAFHW
jgi:hypothetical protein